MRGNATLKGIFFILILPALACSSLQAPAAQEPPYRYDDLPAEGDEDLALAEYNAISYWDKFDLTYYFVNDTQALSGDSERDLVRAAFTLWGAQSPLTFNEVSDPDQADILISWVAGAQSFGDPFDGPGGVLAQASYPNPYTDRQVILQFDNSERWVDSDARNVDLLTVAAHEIGHNLGLDHSDDPDAIMFASYSGPHRFLGADDIAGIQSLYGATRQPAQPPSAPPDNAPPPPSGNEDSDGDGISDADELLQTGTDPENSDSDGDGLGDGVEVLNRMNPLDADMDKDGASDGQEVAAGTDPFFPDQNTSIPPELEQEISIFLTNVIELEIQAFTEGDASLAAPVMAGEVFEQLESNIASLNQRGLVQISALDYYQSYINDIRVINSSRLEVDTCEVWTTATYRASDGSLVQSDGPTLLPQTITVEKLDQDWFVTGVDFFEAPAFCT